MSEQPNDPQQVHVSLEMPDAHKGGVWANFARVSHSPYEFTLDFARIDFATAPDMQGVVVARVNLSPLMVTQTDRGPGDQLGHLRAEGDAP